MTVTDVNFIPIANPTITEDEAREVYECVKSGWLSTGKKVREFEEKIKNYTGARYAVAMNNGTSTLHSALLALNVGQGDEVIVPTMTYISSANVVLYCGAELVLCDCDPKTFNADADEIEKRITSKTKAIMTVDMKGLPVDYDAIGELAKRHGIPVIADSAESLGAGYKGKQVGTQADIHSFSFFANKNITTGEGGMITTESEELYEKMMKIRNQGQDYRYHHVMLGNNYRMTDVLASIGVVQLDRIEWIMEEKSRLVRRYNKAFEGSSLIETPLVPEYATRHSWYMYSLLFVESVDRDRVIQRLKDKKVDTRLSFPPVHIQPYYVERFGYKPDDFPESIKAYSRFLDIPCWAGLTDEQQEHVIESVKEAVEKAI